MLIAADQMHISTVEMVGCSPSILQAGIIDRSLVKNDDMIVVDVSAANNEKVFVRTYNTDNLHDTNQQGTTNPYFPSASYAAMQYQSQNFHRQSFVENNHSEQIYNSSSAPDFSLYNNGFTPVPEQLIKFPYNASTSSIYPCNFGNSQSNNVFIDMAHEKELHATYERLRAMADECDLIDKYNLNSVQCNQNYQRSVINNDRKKLLQRIRTSCLQRQTINSGKYRYASGRSGTSNQFGHQDHNIPSPPTLRRVIPPPPTLRRVFPMSNDALYTTTLPGGSLFTSTHDTRNVNPHLETPRIQATPYTHWYSSDMFELNQNKKEVKPFGSYNHGNINKINQPHELTGSLDQPKDVCWVAGMKQALNSQEVSGTYVREITSDAPCSPYTKSTEFQETSERLKLSPTDSGIDCTEFPEDLNVITSISINPTETRKDESPGDLRLITPTEAKRKGARVKITKKEPQNGETEPKWMMSKMSSWKKRKIENIGSESKNVAERSANAGTNNKDIDLKATCFTKPCKPSNLRTVVETETNHAAMRNNDKLKDSRTELQQDMNLPSPMNLVIDVSEDEEEVEDNRKPKKIIKWFL